MLVLWELFFLLILSVYNISIIFIENNISNKYFLEFIWESMNVFN